MSKRIFPIVVKKGSVEVKIYRCSSKAGYTSYTLSYYQDGVRKRPTFADLKKAEEEAHFVVERLGSTNADVLTLTSADRAAYQRARQLLDPFGVGIEMAAAQFADAKKRLGDVPLSVAVDFYLHRRPHDPEVKKLKVVIDEMIDAKDSDGLSDAYLKELRYHLDKFSARFKDANIGDVSGVEIDSWLRNCGLSPRTRNNIRKAIGTLFRFAKARKYLSRDHDELAAVGIAKQQKSEIEVFTPAELVEILSAADDTIMPFLVVAAFAGVRHAEIQRLDWRDVLLDQGFIQISAAKAKTASRRLVPITDNLREWLVRYRQPEGCVCELLNAPNAFARCITRINRGRADQGIEEKFHWKHNALRHSFISYRLAELQNADQVALEAGTSRQMIFHYYRELVMPVQAKEWFAITPETIAAQKQAGSEVQAPKKMAKPEIDVGL